MQFCELEASAMILIGQYDSPFVRRVAIAMRLYGMAFEHKPWSVFGDADKIAQYNPLMRVPTLVLNTGEALIESHAILDALDQLAPPGLVMMPAGGAERREALKVCALATGMADKAVSLVYESVVHGRATTAWVDRCRSQIAGCLNALERSRTARTTPWWFGPAIGHADVTVACAVRFLGDAHPGLFDIAQGWPMLASHAARCESLPPFQEIQQAFKVTPPGA
jgi:glutathione S-transferase